MKNEPGALGVVAPVLGKLRANIVNMRLDNRDTACVTYAEVERRYPQMSENVRRKLGETAAQPRFLVTVRGVGVMMVEPSS